MITSLSGIVREKEGRFAVIETGGVGFQVFATDDTLHKLKIGSSPRIRTRHIVREDTEELYGFLDENDLRLFELLLGVPGIGPKTALNILNVATPETLRRSITSGETAYLTKIGGIGKKTADKIILELREKLGAGEGGTMLKDEVDALEALKSLGYSHAEARGTLQNISPSISGTSERVKAALKQLGKKS